MTKQCSRCKIKKEDSSFYTGFRRGKSYLYSRCRICCAEVNKEQQTNGRDWELKKKYGISLQQYSEECNKRQNKCDICKHPVKTLHVDHCHTTGKVRGMLCGSCNRGLGLLKDSAQVLQNAATYLKRFNETFNYT